MTDQDKYLPPIGGANLECHFSLGNLEAADFSKVIEVICHAGFSFHGEKPITALAENYVDPLEIPFTGDVEAFAEALIQSEGALIIARFEGCLVDSFVSLSVVASFQSNVLVISTLEDFIWNFTNDPQEGRLERLMAFADLCKRVADEKRPAYTAIGTEGGDIEAFTVDQISKEGQIAPYGEADFSRERLVELYNWYLNEYARRWD